MLNRNQDSNEVNDETFKKYNQFDFANKIVMLNRNQDSNEAND
jgi:hypothetical protein